MFTEYPSAGFAAEPGSWIQHIKQSADTILREVGIQFEGDPDTLDALRQHGAEIDGERVRLDGETLRAIIRATAPGSFGLRARDPAHDCSIGPGHRPVCAPVYGPPNVLLANGQRTSGNRETYRTLVSMADACDGLANTGHMVCVMNDIPEQDRPAEMALAHLECSRKPFMGSVASPDSALEVIGMLRAAMEDRPAGSKGPQDRAQCQLLHLINSSPPLTFKDNPLKCLRAVAQAGEGCVVTSYMMLGATGPVTPAGALAQGYAECLAGLALAQIWRPGTPVVMGLFGTPFSMRAMQPFFGDPLAQTIQIHAVALARDLGVPVRGDGGISSALVDDAQAGFEGGRATNIALMAGCDFVLHAAGWLESGRCVSIGKFTREAKALENLLCSAG